MKKAVILATVVASVLAGASWSCAAVLTLRSGQRVEGELTAATRESVTLLVGTRSVEFPTAEVALIAFGEAPPPQAAPAPEPPPPAPSPSAAVLEDLKALAELGRGEPPLEPYEAHLAEAAGALQTLPEAQRQALSDALAYLRLGAAARRARASKTGYTEISRNEYLDRCTASDAELQVVVKPGADDLVRGIGASVVGARPFVACAAAELARAEAAPGQ